MVARVDVQWSPCLEAWLLPAVNAFSEAVSNCRAPGDQFQACQVTFVVSSSADGGCRSPHGSLCSLDQISASPDVSFCGLSASPSDSRGLHASAASSSCPSSLRRVSFGPHDESICPNSIATDSVTTEDFLPRDLVVSPRSRETTSTRGHAIDAGTESMTMTRKSLFERPELRDGARKLVARLPLRIVSEKPILVTWIGQLFASRKLLKPASLVVISVSMLLNYFDPGSRKVKLSEGVEDEVLIESVLTIWVQAFLNMLFGVGALHFMSFGLFRLSLATFEAWWLMANQVMLMLAVVYNEVCLLSEADEIHIHWILAVSVRLVASLMGVSMLCLVDALVISRCWKLAGCILYALLVSSSYVSIRFLDSSTWTSHDICWYNGCSSPKFLAQLSLANILVFVAKAMGSFLRGREFAFLKCGYEECSTRPEAYLLLSQFVHSEDSHVADGNARNSFHEYLYNHLKAEASPASTRSLGCEDLHIADGDGMRSFQDSLCNHLKVEASPTPTGTTSLDCDMSVDEGECSSSWDLPKGDDIDSASSRMGSTPGADIREGGRAPASDLEKGDEQSSTPPLDCARLKFAL